MKLKPNYLIIPLVTVFVALLGTFFTSSGMEWYNNALIRPALAPPKWAFPVAWTLIFVCTTISVMIIWNKTEKNKRFLWIFRTKEMKPEYQWIIGLFIINAILNVGWSLLFFKMHMLGASLAEMLFLEATNIALLILTWKISKKASVLLVPYALWVALATVLTYLMLI